MNAPTSVQPIQFKPGDEVVQRIVQDESHETLLSATFVEIDAEDTSVACVRFSDGREDWVDAASLTPAPSEDSLDPADKIDPEHPAVTQLLSLYSKTDRIAFTRIHSTRKDEAGRPVSKTDVLSVKTLVSDKSIARLQVLNGEGWNLYFSMNSIQPGETRRKKEFAGEPAHFFMEVDYAGDSTLDSVRHWPRQK